MEQHAYNNTAVAGRSNARSIAIARPLTEDDLSLGESALLMTALFTLISSILAIATL